MRVDWGQDVHIATHGDEIVHVYNWQEDQLLTVYRNKTLFITQTALIWICDWNIQTLLLTIYSSVITSVRLFILNTAEVYMLDFLHFVQRYLINRISCVLVSLLVVSQYCVWIEKHRFWDQHLSLVNVYSSLVLGNPGQIQGRHFPPNLDFHFKKTSF